MSVRCVGWIDRTRWSERLLQTYPGNLSSRDHSQRVNLTTRLGRTLYFQHLRFRHHSCSSPFPEPRAARIGMGNCSRQPSSTSGVDQSRPSCIKWCSVNYAPLCRCARRKTGHYRHLWCKSLRSFCAAVFWPMASLEYVAVTVVMIGWSDWPVVHTAPPLIMVLNVRLRATCT